MYPPPPRHLSQHVLYRHKREGNRVDTIGGRRDEEGDKEKDANQRCAASCTEMPTQMKGKGSEQARETCLRLENLFLKGRGF